MPALSLMAQLQWPPFQEIKCFLSLSNSTSSFASSSFFQHIASFFFIFLLILQNSFPQNSSIQAPNFDFQANNVLNM
ncbi:hypothetical protein LguiA_004216 [Lonicera macranthoides]